MAKSKSSGFKIALRNKASPPLLRLPAELRNQIYEYVLTKGKYDMWVYTFMATNKRRNALALLLVCRKIYDESKLLPFSLNTFVFPHFASSYHTLVAGTQTAQREAIRTIRMTFFVREDEDLITEMEDCNLFALSEAFPALQSVHLLLKGDLVERYLEEGEECLEQIIRSGVDEGVDLEIAYHGYE